MTSVRNDLENAKIAGTGAIPPDHTPGFGPDDVRIWIRRCDPYPEYILLVGDAADYGQPDSEGRVPARPTRYLANNPLADEFYCSDLDTPDQDTGKPCAVPGDCAPGHFCDDETEIKACRPRHIPDLPEIFCGRLPAVSLDDLKVLSGDTDYATENGLPQSVAGKLTEFQELDGGAAGNRRVCSSFAPSSFAVNSMRDDLYLSGYAGAVIDETSAVFGEDREDFRDCLNEGPVLATYRGHGGQHGLFGLDFYMDWFESVTGWTDPVGAGLSDVLPVFLSVACATADFRHVGGSIGESLVLAEGRGAAMYLGATVSSPHFRNTTFSSALASMAFQFDPPTSNGYSLGQLVALAKARVVLVWGLAPEDNYYGDQTRRLLDEYLILGDASARLPVRNNDLVGFWRFDSSKGPWLDHSARGWDAHDSNGLDALGQPLQEFEPVTSFVENGRTGGRKCPEMGACSAKVPAFSLDFETSLSFNCWLWRNAYTEEMLLQYGSLLTFDFQVPTQGPTQQKLVVSLPGCASKEIILPAPLDAWEMLSLTWDGVTGNALVYADGKLLGSVAGCFGSLNLQGSELILAEKLELGFDEFRLYDTVLSPQDIARIYQFDAQYFKLGPAAELSFDSEYSPNQMGIGAPLVDLPEYLDSGSGLRGLYLGPGSVLLQTQGIVGEAVFLGGPDYLVLDDVQDGTSCAGGFGATFWLRPRLPANGQPQGTVVAEPGVLDVFADYVNHRLCLTDTGHCSSGDFESVSGTLDYGRWRAYGVSVDSASAQVTWFVDGIPVAQGPAPEGLQCGKLAGLAVGKGYEGDLDELRVYPRPLTFSDVAADSLRQGVNVSFDFEPAAVRMDDLGAMDTLFDISGFENNGTLTNLQLCKDGAPPGGFAYCGDVVPLVQTSARFPQQGDPAYVEFSDSMDDSVSGFAVSVWLEVADLGETGSIRSVWRKGDWLSLEILTNDDPSKVDDEMRFAVGGMTTSVPFPHSGGWAHVGLSVSRTASGCSADVWGAPRSADAPAHQSIPCGDFAWDNGSWTLGGKTEPDRFVGLMDQFDLFYVPLAESYVKDALFDHPAHYSWAAAEYPMDAGYDGLALDATPYGNVGALLQGHSTILGMAADSGWWPDHSAFCPESSPCIEFGGELSWLESKGPGTFPGFSAEAHSNSGGDQGVCYWQRANPDIGVLTTSVSARARRVTGLAGIKTGSESVLRIAQEVDRCALEKGKTPVGSFTGLQPSLFRLADIPCFGEWRRVCADASRLTGVARLFMDGALAGAAALGDVPAASESPAIYVGQSGLETAGYTGNLTGVEFLSRSPLRGGEFLAAAGSQVRSHYRFDGHTLDSGPSLRHLSTAAGGPVLTDDGGLVGGALELNGSAALKAGAPAIPDGSSGQSLWIGTAFKTASTDPQDILGLGSAAGQQLEVGIAENDTVTVKLHDHLLVSLTKPVTAAAYADGNWHGLGLSILATNSEGNPNGPCNVYRVKLFYDGLPCEADSCQAEVSTDTCEPFGGTLFVGTGPGSPDCAPPGASCFSGALDELFVSTVPMDESQVRFMFHRVLGVWSMEGLDKEALDPFHVASQLGAAGAHGYLSSSITCGGSGDTLCDLSSLFSCGVGPSPSNAAGTGCLRLGYPDPLLPAGRVDFSFARNSLVEEMEREFTHAAWVYLLDNENAPYGNALLVAGRGDDTARGILVGLDWDQVFVHLNGRTTSLPYAVQRNKWVHVALSVDPQAGKATLRLQPQGASATSFLVPVKAGPRLLPGDPGTGCG